MLEHFGGIFVVPTNWQEHREELQKLGACCKGYPNMGLPCLRPNDHSPFDDCFSLKERDGVLYGVFMVQDGKEWVADQKKWPKDLVVKDKPWPNIDRRGAIAHTKAKS